ncbi:MAG: hypothetical protein KF878_30475 [Planctomycetes bacterium]|nr:hypothetical protein [Planctomycetota bacterium]
MRLATVSSFMGLGALSLAAVAGLLVLAAADERGAPAPPRPAASRPALPAALRAGDRPEASRSTSAACSIGDARAAAVASTTLAALPPGLEAAEVDAMEARSRAQLARQLVVWLGAEDHPVAALIEADQLAALARWLPDDAVDALHRMARDDPNDARRRAAFIVLGRLPEPPASHPDRLLAAFERRPSEAARAGLVEALLTLGRAGLPVDAALARALDDAHGPPSAALLALVSADDPRAVRVVTPAEGPR